MPALSWFLDAFASFLGSRLASGCTASAVLSFELPSSALRSSALCSSALRSSALNSSAFLAASLFRSIFTKKPFFGSRPFTTLQASMYFGWSLLSDICLLFAVRSFLLSFPVRLTTSASRAAIRVSVSALKASAAGRSVSTDSAALKSFKPASACFMTSPMPETWSADLVMVVMAKGRCSPRRTPGATGGEQPCSPSRRRKKSLEEPRRA
mmetsp:Transcript_74734/g.160160  ORF Transcript_74734/g.160160 Transcript_74734/m.160160 type:complete len:210 (+) Transcript_74734:470-1099(+)